MWSRDAFSASRASGCQKRGRLLAGYQITCPPTTTPAEVSLLPGVPRVGDEYEDNPDLLVTNRDFQRVGPIYWVAIVTYEGDFPKFACPEIEWRSVTSTEAIDEDFDGNPIVTANGEPLEGVTKEISDAVQTIRRQYLTINIPAIHQYIDSVNSDTFSGFGPGIARLTDYSAKAVWGDEVIDHWVVTATIVYRFPYNTTAEKAWYARVRHEGFYEKLGSGEIVRAVDNYKEPVTRPIQLKEDGTRETDPNEAFFKEFKRYGQLSYNALGLLD